MRALEWLLTEWAYLLDHGRASELVGLFTDDGIYDSAGLRSSGREALAVRFAARQSRERTSRHVWSNLRLTPGAAGEIAGEALVLVFRHDGPGVGRAHPALVLDLVDRYRLVQGRWLIAARTLTRIFHDPAAG